MTRLLLLTALLSGCATSYRPTDTGPGAFSFTLTPEQCEHLKEEQRNYHAVHQDAGYVSAAGPMVTTLLLAIPALRDEHALQGAAAGVSLVAGGTLVFTDTQLTDLDQEIEEGGCR